MLLPTGDTNALNIIRNHALALHDIVQLRARTMQYDRVQSHTVQERQRERKLIDLVEHRASDFDDGELGGVVRVGGGAEDAQVALDLLFGPDGVEQPGDGVLNKMCLLVCAMRIYEGTVNYGTMDSRGQSERRNG
jgi:hypothetical protein